MEFNQSALYHFRLFLYTRACSYTHMQCFFTKKFQLLPSVIQSPRQWSMPKMYSRASGTAVNIFVLELTWHGKEGSVNEQLPSPGCCREMSVHGVYRHYPVCISCLGQRGAHSWLPNSLHYVIHLHWGELWWDTIIVSLPGGRIGIRKMNVLAGAPPLDTQLLNMQVQIKSAGLAKWGTHNIAVHISRFGFIEKKLCVEWGSTNAGCSLCLDQSYPILNSFSSPVIIFANFSSQWCVVHCDQASILSGVCIAPGMES